MNAEFPPVAIVGEGCVLPGAIGAPALWSLVAEGRSALSHGGHSFGSGIGGYVRDFEHARDLSGYRLSEPRLADLDPVFLWTLHAAREALRSAGIQIGREPRGAVVLGNLSYPTPALCAFASQVLANGPREAAASGSVDPRNRFMSGLPASLVAEAIGFGGEAFALDAACASSLYAVKLACDILHAGTADVVIAGGTNHTGDLFLHAGFLSLGALSPTGRSRPFHRDADGLVPAQGSAVIVLRRLEDAVRSKSPILGVIRGIGLSNDGRGRGLLVPAEDGQVRAMRAAYAMSGLSPKDISFVECHATGTQLGDATELRSMTTVFDGVRDLPLGSLKSNVGHLVTASGAAGIIKVLGAFRAHTLPPTLHADALLDELRRSGPLRVVREPEPWRCDGPRRAAVNNFGFGGNNAHLLIEEWTGAVTSSPLSRATPAREDIAIVAKAVTVGATRSTDEFDTAVLDARTLLVGAPPEAPFGSVELDAGDVRFPPADLEETLPQQLVMMRLASEIDEGVRGLVPERTMLVVGMQVDGNVTRHSLRMEEAARQGSSRSPLSAAAIVGCMPNVVANRLNHQLNIRGPSFTVSAEEASGTVALGLAAGALARGEVDLALVGAVDLSCEPVHRAAAAGVLGEDRQTPGDAAVLLAVKRLSDARANGDPILAVLTGDEPDPVLALSLDDDGAGLSGLFGHAHAASGLLHVAAAIVSCQRHALPARAGVPAMPWLPIREARRASVEVKALGGATTRTSLRAASFGRHARRDPREPCLAIFGGDSERELLGALARGEPGEPGDLRVAVVAPSEAALAGRIERARECLRDGVPGANTVLDDGIYFGKGPLLGDVAFVFTGPAGAYPHMGRELALGLPDLVDALSAKSATVGETIGFLYEAASSWSPSTEQKLFASSYLTQLHSELTRGLLGIAPQASIGYCSGETNALFALGAWTDFDEFQQKITQAGVFTRELAGELGALRRAWHLGAHDSADWTTYRVLAPVDTVRAALRSESQAHLTIINSPNDVIVAGSPEACGRVGERMGAVKMRSLGYDVVMHCPEAEAYAAEWHAIHHRPTTAVPGIRFYTHATCKSYALCDSSAADALTGQALRTVDFPAMISQAYADGVRVFIEHGPHAGCTKWTDDVLGDRPHLAVALDRFGRSSLLQVIDSIAALVAAGVPMNHAVVSERLGPPRPAQRAAQQGAAASRKLHFEAHPRTSPSAPVPHEEAEVMAPAPRLPSAPPRGVLETAGLVHIPADLQPDVPASRALSLTENLADLHIAFLREQTRAHAEFLRAYFGTTAPAPAQAAPRPTFTRAELETLASGRISSVFGALFEQQDDYARQVRMPEPPLLLADRVTRIDAEPGSMGVGTIWTETDILPDAWYLHEGRMPTGIFVEAGQADLLLVSWLGIDFHNRGERVYRLLGCELETYGELPHVGDLLAYEIRIDSHAHHGDVHIFSFSSACWVNGELRMAVRNGQAGFFTDADLAGSTGVRWSAEDTPATPQEGARMDLPPVRCTKTRLDAAEIGAFALGDAYRCFGAGFERATTHTRTPTIQGGRMRLVDEVTVLAPTGGPWGRGFMQARLAILQDHWFFAGHFKNDPCMPGTLLLEGSVQAMAIYLAALGYTLPRDGWRFEVATEEPYVLRCRGQTTPKSRELVYEIFVHELAGGPMPTVYADVLGIVDGLKAFHVRRLAVRLVPGYPIDIGRLELPEAPDTRPAARLGNFVFDRNAMLASALGRPTAAFGDDYGRFDGSFPLPRLPAPPYLFVSRVIRVEGPQNGMQIGSVAEAEYDVPPEAWYLAENGRPFIPFGVLLEIALQPCGWLATYVGCVYSATGALTVRNLDGVGTLEAEVARDVGTLTTTVTLKSLSTVGTLMLVSFEVETRAGDRIVYRATSGFGFFTPEAVLHQVGLPTDDKARARLTEVSSPVDLEALRVRAGSLSLPRGQKLPMLDRVTGFWPNGGKAGLGRIRGEKDVRPTDWFFKAHFFQDPVQPGSLGLEAMAQALEVLLTLRGVPAGMRNPRFDAATSVPMTWKYRGQVVPENRLVVIELELVTLRDEPGGLVAIAEASLWIDDKRIYEAKGLSTRIVAG